MSRRFGVGDIHGEKEKLISCLEQVGFDYEDDKLICIGDICDRGKDTWGVVETLLKIKKRRCVRGNHDQWFWEYLSNDHKLSPQLSSYWIPQGGLETIQSYEKVEWKNLEQHKEFFKEQLRYYTEKGQLFVHAGIELGQPMIYQNDHFLMWDRDFVMEVFTPSNTRTKIETYEDFDTIFIGHTPCGKVPKHQSNVWNLDTGSGKGGILTMMNLDTFEYVQSK